MIRRYHQSLTCEWGGRNREAHVCAIYMRIYLEPPSYITAQWDSQRRKRKQKEKGRDGNKMPMAPRSKRGEPLTWVKSQA